MIVFHGSINPVIKPDTEHSFRNLDFGAGFYVTSVRQQAERWAKRKAALADKYAKPIITEYECINSFEDCNILNFDSNLEEWIDFVCSCRNGKNIFKKYDVIIGKVANDKVYRVVDLYLKGIWDKSRAIQEMRIYDTYDQIAFITQKAIDKSLKYIRSYEVK